MLHRLKKVVYIAAIDNIFFKVYFAMTIGAKELQYEVNGFLSDSKAEYTETLELFHVESRV